MRLTPTLQKERRTATANSPGSLARGAVRPGRAPRTRQALRQSPPRPQ
jgi:hypothetical protein